MSTIADAIKINAELVVLHRKKGDLLEQLGRALQIKEIWPEAFDHGAVEFGGIKMEQHSFGRSAPAYTMAWLKDSFGYKRYLTKKELKVLKPEAIIHQEYKENQ